MKNTTLLILLSLFIISCDEDNPVSGSNEVDVDWVFINIPEMDMEYYTQSGNQTGSGINVFIQNYYVFNGYKLFFSSSSGINIEEITINNGLLTFTYNDEIFTYDISDSYYQESDDYTFQKVQYGDRIILNTEMNYLTSFSSSLYGGSTSGYDVSSPNELIDYR